MIFGWILGWLLDHFWFQNSMKKTIDFLIVFWIDFGWFLGCLLGAKLHQKIDGIQDTIFDQLLLIFGPFFHGFWVSKVVSQNRLFWASSILAVRAFHWDSRDPPGAPFGWPGLPFWATLVPLGSPNGAKTLPKSIKHLIIFWIDFWMRFCPKMVPKMAPKTIQSPSKIHSRPNLVWKTWFSR